jgi:4-hydroxy-4-methyl-2-oxoglutarate aldolase
VDPESLAEAKRLGSATLYEAAGQKGALPSEILPIARTMRVSGPALPVATPPGNNLWIHRALATASPGDVLVVATSAPDFGYWGDIMTEAALARKVAGLVIDGCVRDSEAIEKRGFAVFARGRSIRGTTKDPSAPGSLGALIRLGNVAVKAGDLVVGDADGVVVIPRARATEVLETARERESREAEVLERLRRGETTLEIYGWE